MPLLDPLNDRGCLLQLHKRVLEFMETDQARSLAAQFEEIDELIAHIRTLFQRDDLGDPRDGPRLMCDVTQRLRLPAEDPNCFERLALFLGLALRIDPSRHLTSTTMMLDEGLHSFPVEIRDGVPRAVVLDPISPPLNMMNAAAYQVRNASPMTSENIAPWFTELARNACIEEGVEDLYELAMASIRNSLLTGEPIDAPDAIESVLSLAYPDASLFGAKGQTAYRRVRNSVRNLSLGLNPKTMSTLLNGLIQNAEPLASQAIKTALIAKFGPAAAIALQGVDLALKEPSSQANDDQANDNQADVDQESSLTNVESLKLTLESSDDDARETLISEQKRQRLRRMTFAFRQPEKTKES